MEFINNKSFDLYVESYKKLPLSDKKEIVVEEIYSIFSLFEKLNTKPHQEYKVLFNREILDLKKENATEDDFVEAMFVYINMIEEMLSDHIDNNNKEEETWKK